MVIAGLIASGQLTQAQDIGSINGTAIPDSQFNQVLSGALHQGRVFRHLPSRFGIRITWNSELLPCMNF